MPGAKLSMRKIREIMRLKFSLGMNNRDIASSCNISPGTVSETLFRLKLREIQWPLPDILTDEKLEEKLFPIPADGLEDRNVPQWEEIYRELQKKHVTLMLLWQEYHEQYPDGMATAGFVNTTMNGDKNWTWLCVNTIYSVKSALLIMPVPLFQSLIPIPER